MLLSKDIIVGVQGHAGSGKTTMLREVKELVGGRRIQGLAPSAAAARVLGREAGIPTTTLQYFLTRYGDLLDPEQLDKARANHRGTVLAVDECSMIDTGRMRELLRIAERLGVARVALVGDTEQLRPVDAGQPFRLLQKAGMRTATMDEVLRQRDPALLASVMHARHGEAGEAIRGLGAAAGARGGARGTRRRGGAVLARARRRRTARRPRSWRRPTRSAGRPTRRCARGWPGRVSCMGGRSSSTGWSTGASPGRWPPT